MQIEKIPNDNYEYEFTVCVKVNDNKIIEYGFTNGWEAEKKALENKTYVGHNVRIQGKKLLTK